MNVLYRVSRDFQCLLSVLYVRRCKSAAKSVGLDFVRIFFKRSDLTGNTNLSVF